MQNASVMQNAEFANYRYKENECENTHKISIFLKDFLKKVSLDFRFSKVDGNYS